MQEKGWPAHAYHTNKILLELKDRQQREKQTEREKFNSIKRNVLRCWAWSQSILRHGSPAHLGTVRQGMICTKALTGKRTNFLLKVLCLQGTEQHWGKTTKLQGIWNTELFPRVSGISQDDFPCILQELVLYRIVKLCHFSYSFILFQKWYFYNLHGSSEFSQMFKWKQRLDVKLTDDLQLAADKTDGSLLLPIPHLNPWDASDSRGSLDLRAERNRYPGPRTAFISPLQPHTHVWSTKPSLYNPTLLVLEHLTIFAHSSLHQSYLIWNTITSMTYAELSLGF